jgi:hypothetical protein
MVEFELQFPYIKETWHHTNKTKSIFPILLYHKNKIKIRKILINKYYTNGNLS